jgi:hypothetical protein
MNLTEFNNITTKLKTILCKPRTAPLLTNVKPLSVKRETNPSVILSADMQIEDKTIKTVIKAYCQSDKALDSEKKFYTEVIPNLYKHSPHIMKCFAVIHCPEQELNQYLELTNTEVVTALTNIGCNATNKTYNLIILENLENSDHIDKIKTKVPANELDKVLKQVMFQLLYTVECFVRVGVRHNDLFYENILLVELSTPRTTKYTIDGKDYFLTYKYTPVIFDFDKSSSYIAPIIEPAVANLEDICPDTGICNGPNTIFDVLRVIALYEKTLKPGWIEANMKSMCPHMKYAITIANRSNKKTSFSIRHGLPEEEKVVAYFPEALQLLNLYFTEYTTKTTEPQDSYLLPAKSTKKTGLIGTILKNYFKKAKKEFKKYKQQIEFYDNKDLFTGENATIYIGTKEGLFKVLNSTHHDTVNKLFITTGFNYFEFLPDNQNLYFTDQTQLKNVLGHIKDKIIANAGQGTGLCKQTGGDDSIYDTYKTDKADDSFYSSINQEIICSPETNKIKIFIQDNTKLKDILQILADTAEDPLFFYQLIFLFDSSLKDEITKLNNNRFDIQPLAGGSHIDYHKKYKKYKHKYLALKNKFNTK